MHCSVVVESNTYFQVYKWPGKDDQVEISRYITVRYIDCQVQKLQGRDDQVNGDVGNAIHNT